MAITATTLSGAVGYGDVSINVASATGFLNGQLIRIDNELMVQTAINGTFVSVRRGAEGTVQSAHPTASKVLTGLNFSGGVQGDFQNPQSASDPTTMLPVQRPRYVTGYSASGAITLPTPGSDAIAMLNGTGALAMTLANPSTAQDGDLLYVIGNGKAAHTVTYTAGLGNGGSSLDVGTAASGNQCCVLLMAAGGFWVHVGLPSATGAANAFIWA